MRNAKYFKSSSVLNMLCYLQIFEVGPELI